MARGRTPIHHVILCLFACLLPLALAQAQEDRFTEGVRQYQDGQYQEAAKAFEEATTANPDFESAWYYLGVCRLKLLDYEGALAAFQKAVDLAPARPGTRLMVGQIYESQHVYDEAVKVYQDELRYRRGKDILPVLNALGRASYYAGQYPEAIATLEKVVTEDDKYVEAFYTLGLAQAARKNDTQAVKYFDTAGTTLEEWRRLVTRLARLRTLQAKGGITPQQEREIGSVDEQLAQDYGRAQDFGTELGLWPALNKARGNSLVALKEWAAARNSYRKALDKEQLGSPSDADAYTLMSLGLLALAKSVFMVDSLLYQMIDLL